MSQPLIDHRGPQFAVLLGEVLEGLKKLFKTAQVKSSSSPARAQEGGSACIVNTLSPGDKCWLCERPLQRSILSHCQSTE